MDSRRCGRRTTRGGHSPRRWTLTAIPTHGSTLLRTGRCSIPAPAKETYYLRTSGAGQWTFVDNNRVNDIRDAGTSVTYDDGKVLIIGGGGGNPMATLPRRECEMINLNVSPVISNTTTSVAPTPQWRRVGDMAFGSPPVERDATA
jgi:hypothetical protein